MWRGYVMFQSIDWRLRILFSPLLWIGKGQAGISTITFSWHNNKNGCSLVQCYFSFYCSRSLHVVWLQHFLPSLQISSWSGNKVCCILTSLKQANIWLWLLTRAQADTSSVNSSYLYWKHTSKLSAISPEYKVRTCACGETKCTFDSSAMPQTYKHVTSKCWVKVRKTPGEKLLITPAAF